MDPQEISEAAKKIAEQLGETGAGPREQIRRAFEVAGPETVQAALEEAQRIEASGGLMLKDGSRRRTPGGVFFYVLRQRVSREEWRRIQPEAPKAPAPPPPPPLQPLAWEERAELVQAALARPGTAGFARMTVVGRPLEVKPREGFVVATLEGGERLPPLPHGLPQVPSLRTIYKVAIADHQWRSLASALNNPEDMLVAEGFAFLNVKTGSVIVLAQRAMTKLAQRREKPLRRYSG
ncbi:MAG: phosphorylated adapter RNA export RNA-binding domain-containing protein [Anaerolineales bacterium]|nr:phosphorylated adapter RNA export RNA-binding domain-containing protein [Anaerolineales bacterium]